MASVTDILFIAVVLFIVGLAMTIIVGVSHQLNLKFLNVSTFNTSTTASNVISKADTALNSTDYMYAALFLGLFLSILITGYLVGGMPIGAPIYFFIIILFVFVSVILQMTWGDISASSSIAGYLSSLPITNFILGHLGMFTAIFGLSGLLIMFAKPQGTI